MPTLNGDNRGQWYVGLNPDERMPNDWLRMVARVFTAYRKQPLQESIVSYIDGLNISIGTRRPSSVDILITPGQAFVDDQFIGFIEDSIFEAPLTQLETSIFGTRFFIVLKYKFINQYPPQEPSFDLVLDNEINSEEMLVLGYLECEDNGIGGCNLIIVDEKQPWWREWVAAAVGNTEVDSSSLLPYIIAIKSGGNAEEGGSAFPDGDPLDEEGTIDIGWAIDFHHYIGNQYNYDVRLHTDKVGNSLFINNNKLITEVGEDAGAEFDDPQDLGDKTVIFNNNMTIVDTIDSLNGDPYPASNSGKACYNLKTVKVDFNGISNIKFSSICSDHDDSSLTLVNQDSDQNPINVLKLTDTEDIITINGKNIWHSGNLTTGSNTIIFLGYLDVDLSNPPTERPPNPSYGDLTLQSGDTFYSNIEQSYYYYVITNDPNIGDGIWTPVGTSDLVKSYQFVVTDENQTTISVEYNPEYVLISLGGSVLAGNNRDQDGNVTPNPAAEYIASDGQNIIFLNPLRVGEIIKVYTTLAAQAFGARLDELSNVQISGLEHGQSLVYNNAVGRWENTMVTGGTGGDVEFLNDVGDVNVGSGIPGNFLVRNSTNTLWVSEKAYLETLGDTSINSPSINQVLAYNGTTWVNTTPSSSGDPIAIDDLTDVMTSGSYVPAINDVLTWYNGQWIPKEVPTSGGTVPTSIDDLTDVTTSGGYIPNDNEVLTWQTSQWIPQIVETGIQNIIWKSTLEYITDDAVSFDGLLYIASQPSQNIQPNLYPNFWIPQMVETGIQNIIWKSTLEYITDDAVSFDGQLYVASQPSQNIQPNLYPNFWIPQRESGVPSSSWAMGINYTSGNIVSFNQEVYIALTANIDKQPDTNPADWKLASGTTAGDTREDYWIPTEIYGEGDTVSYNSKFYISLTTNQNRQPDTNPADWKLSNSGGNLWLTSIQYSVGDVASYNRELYIAITSNINKQPDTNNLDWELSNPGGALWSTIIPYSTGDIVSHGNEAFIAIIDSIGRQPNTNPLHWERANPEGVSFIDDLNDVTTSGIYAPVESDILTWDDNLQLWVPRSNVATDSMVWDPNRTYILDDVVSYEGILYVASQESLNKQPDINEDYWIPQREDGVPSSLWDPAIEYTPGAVVSFEELLYISLTVNLNRQPNLNPTDWKLSSSDGSSVGSLWVDTVIYTIGDVVSFDAILYVALTVNQAKQPDLNPSDWSPTDPDTQLDIEWDPTIEYEIGDLVTRDTKLYTAVVATLNKDPRYYYGHLNPEYWRENVSSNQEWLEKKQYFAGDIVQHLGSYYTAQADNLNEEPYVSGNGGQSSYWKPTLVSMIDWNSLTLYKTGDSATYLGRIYLAKLDNLNRNPADVNNNAYWEQISNQSVVVGANNQNFSIYYPDGMLQCVNRHAEFATTRSGLDGNGMSWHCSHIWNFAAISSSGNSFINTNYAISFVSVETPIPGWNNTLPYTGEGDVLQAGNVVQRAIDRNNSSIELIFWTPGMWWPPGDIADDPEEDDVTDPHYIGDHAYADCSALGRWK